MNTHIDAASYQPQPFSHADNVNGVLNLPGVIGGGGIQSVNYSANTFYLSPIYVGSPKQVTAYALECLVANPGGQAAAGIYATDKNFTTYRKVSQSGVLALDTVAVVEVAGDNAILQPGNYVILYCGNTPLAQVRTTRGWHVGGSVITLGSAVPFLSERTGPLPGFPVLPDTVQPLAGATTSYASIGSLYPVIPRLKNV